MAEMTTAQKLALIESVNGGLSRVDLVCAADIKPEPIRWLWPGWFARKKLAILAGMAGTGKTTVLISLAATLTNAGRWPDGTPCRTPGNVLIWSSEDDPADTLIPRLMAADADLSRIHIVRGAIAPDGEPVPFDPANDIAMLHRAVDQIGGAALLMVDPIVSAVGGDMHKANDVRRSLQALVDFAAGRDCAVIGISHFAKGSKGSSPQERVIGSQAFSALARTVLVCAKQEDGESRVLARAKSNISQDDGGIAYSIECAMVAGAIETTRILWGDAVEGSAREILGEFEAEPENGETTEREDAEQFLLDLLACGPVPTKQIRVDAAGAGYAWRTVERAKKSLGVDALKEGGAFGGGKQQWVWRLAEDRQQSHNTASKNSGGLQESVAVFSTGSEEFDV